MSTSTKKFPGSQSLILLSRLLLAPEGDNADAPAEDLTYELLQLRREEFDDLLNLANLNHVVIRAFREVPERDAPGR